ncbi:C40 family peptidase [Corynebacterium lizhenjunii]|uniref:C40 family peptidase n=1 Tax=Corynebacterium lizhenjunii TaxID=2709394 RepID=A0A7T0KGD5_9CORY|nr:NlpC/P60 family protein [Corynebacterium lizhenjunii]QPK80210.1 C40 family peptidase [Corynebacterium lizhenjunii]
MATTHTPRRRFRLRSYMAAVACTASLSTVATLTPPAAHAEEQGSTLEQLTRAFSSGHGSWAQLAGALATVESQVAQLENQMGAYREAVNRALVDLQDARTQYKQAQQGAATAQAEVEAAERAIAAVQEKLAELAGTQFRGAERSDVLTAAAGSRSRGDAAERAALLESQTVSQQQLLEELEAKRAEKAAKEKQLRQVEGLAKDRAESAEQAQADAQAALADSQEAVRAATERHEDLVAQRDAARAALSSAPAPAAYAARAKAAESADAPSVPTSAPSAGTPQPAQVATAAPSAVEADAAVPSAPAGAAPSAVEADTAVPSAPAGAAPLATEGAAPSVLVEPEAREDAAREQDVDQGASASTGAGAEPAAAAPEAGSSVDPQVFAQAAGLIAASQPVHTALVAGSSADEGHLAALQNALTVAADVLGAGAEEAAAAGADTTGLEGILTPLESSETVTEQAMELVESAGTDARIEAVIARAQSQIGTPYAWGGGDANGPTRGIRDGGVADSFGDFNKTGFDCSGLILYAFAAAGISLPHNSGYQYNHGTKVPVSQMQRGDLIFYGPGGGNHVALYLGDGMMIEAPQSGGTVQTTPVRTGGMAPYAVRLI